jgi:2-dehydropantoate 2-reductase
VTRALWEKFAGLAALAAMTCLMRGTVGDILGSDDGAALFGRSCAACLGAASAASAAGPAPRATALGALRALWPDPASKTTASILRDLQAGGRTEAAHVVGDMRRRVRAAAIDDAGGLAAAGCPLQLAARQRRGAAAA